MKIIVTEDQFKLLQENDNDFIKTKSVISSMYDQGMEISDIEKYTGLDYDVIILCLKDKKIISGGDCEEIYDLVYDYLYRTEFINKYHKYSDGSTITIDVDDEYTAQFEYTAADGDYVYGYGTFLWNGDCDWPLDVDYFKSGFDRIDDPKFYGMIDWSLYNDEFMKIETMDDIINFFNNHYFELIKSPIDKLIEDYRTDLLEMD